MRRYLGLPILLLATALTACRGPGPGARPPIGAPAPQAELQQQEQARLCRQTSRTVSSELAALRQVERRLSGLRQEVDPGASSPAPLWDGAREQRYSEQDRDLDRQRYERQLAAWQRQQAAGRQAWDGRHRRELAGAQSELNARSRRLRRLRPNLFTGPTSIEVNPAVLDQILRCAPTG